MASSKSVNILQLDQITPSSNSVLTELTLPLTFSDTFWFKFPPNERVIFYKLAEPSNESFESQVLPKLKHSLEIALFHYLPLAGRLTWDEDEPKPKIKYTPNDYVSLTIAESTGNMAYLAGNGVREAVELHPLIPELSISDHKGSIISLQITFFAGQGFCIGITSHHGVVDGQTLTMFIKSWAYICKELVQHDGKKVMVSLPEDLTPLFDRNCIKDPDGIDMKLVNLWLNYLKTDSDPVKRNLKLLPFLEVNPQLVRATFELSREDISKLRDMVPQNGDVKALRLSTFVLSYAYVLVCMVKARGGDENRSVLYGFTADYRSRLEPPVPSTYFGNCVGVNMGFSKAGDFTGENGFSIAVEKISDLVTSLDTEHFERANDHLEVAMNIKPGTQGISVAGSTRFGIYGADFGWGKPEKMEVVSIDRTGALSMSDRKDKSGGVELGLSMNKEEMKMFSQFFFDGLGH